MFCKTFFFLALLVLAVSAACSPAVPTTSPADNAAIANPASAFCEENGGKLEMRADETGGQYGVCIFPDSTECEEWAYFRGECQPGASPETLVPMETPLPDSTEEIIDGWKVYRNENLGFSFQYPADATLQTDNPARYISVVGPLADNEHWPVFYISHPTDRADYRPPEGVDLAQWLVDNNLLVEERREDILIAGVPAIHTHFESESGQSYPSDTFYFAKNGQLYQIVILHAGKEDWNVYNRFLESIRFE